jgi:hypothetical protein
MIRHDPHLRQALDHQRERLAHAYAHRVMLRSSWRPERDDSEIATRTNCTRPVVTDERL